MRVEMEMGYICEVVHPRINVINAPNLENTEDWKYRIWVWVMVLLLGSEFIR